MHVILFVLGLMLSSAGLAVAAYGFREIEFTIGTTLILAGTVAGTGGLLLIGFAATVYHLRRISSIRIPQSGRADDLPAEPALPGSAARNVPMTAPAAAPMAATMPAPARIPFPPKPTVSRAPERAPELRVPEPRAVEPEPDTGPDPIFGDMLGHAAAEFPAEPRFDQPRVEPRMEQPRVEPPRIESPRQEPARAESPRLEPRATPVAAPPVAPPSVAPSRPVEPPLVDEADEVPLSPRPPAKVQLRHQPAPPLTRGRSAERTVPNGNANNGNVAPVDEGRADDAAPAGDREEPAINFDSLWPAADKRPTRPGSRATPVAPPAPFVERRGEAARREVVRPEPPRRHQDAVTAEAPKVEAARSEPVRAPTGRAEPPALRVEPVARFEPSPVRAEPYVPGTEPPALRIESEQPLAAPAAPSADSQRAVAILKSGVVDGMAYTLYADGSIEAQLPAGTLRFSSIAELREHIEKNS